MPLAPNELVRTGAAVIVGIDQRRQGEQRLGIRGGNVRNRVQPVILDLNLPTRSDRPVGRFDQMGAIDCPHDGSDRRGTLLCVPSASMERGGLVFKQRADDLDVALAGGKHRAARQVQGRILGVIARHCF